LAHTDSSTTYPSANIDPRKKGYDWLLQYCKAAFKDSRGYMPNGSINLGNLKMSEIKLYAMGKQPVDKYKKAISPGNPTDPSWRAISWEPLGLMVKPRNIAVSKVLQSRIDIQCYAVDPLAKSQEDEYFNRMKVKIMAREAAEKMGSELAESPELAPQPNEPQDMEQLQMEKEFGYKHIMAMEAENAINLVDGQNNREEIDKQIAISLVDFGIAATTQYLDENGMVKECVIDMEQFGCSYFEKPDGSDMVHWFTVVPTYVGDLAPFYTKEQLDKICELAKSKNGNPGTYTTVSGLFNPAWNVFKVNVMKIKFLSWNETIYKEETDGRENVRFGKSAYENKQFLSVGESGELQETPTEERGEATPKYINSTKKVVYKASWIVDTDMMHDYGLQENQNRKLSSWWDTDLDIQIYAWNFYKMQFSGLTEMLIKLEDEACITWYNLQNLSRKLIPYLINIDFNAVEAVNFGKTGTKQEPSEIIDFIFSNFVVPYRSTDLLSRNPNYKPVSIEATGQLAAFAQLYEKFEHTRQLMNQLVGLNDATDGSTLNSKNLTSTNETMVEATNNALYLVSEGAKQLKIKAADAKVQKVQIAVKLGKVEGYAKALGTDTVDFFSINPDISLHELAIFATPAPTASERQALWQDLNIKESQGLITIADKYFIMTCRNLKQATMLLDYKIQKRQEAAHLRQLEVLREQTEGNVKTTQEAGEETRATEEFKAGLQMQIIQATKMWDYEIEAMKKQTDLQGEIVQAEGRNIGHTIQARAKVIASEIAAEAAKSRAKTPAKK
jgi:hypothetical protein